MELTGGEPEAISILADSLKRSLEVSMVLSHIYTG